MRSTPDTRAVLPWRQPTPAQIRTARRGRGHTIAQAAGTIDVARVTWEKWEHGTNPMHPAYWLAYHLRSDHHALLHLPHDV